MSGSGENVCIELTVSKLGTRRKVDPRAIREEDTELLHVAKDILDRGSLRPIVGILSRAKTHVRDHRALAVPILRAGVSMLPLGLMSEVDAFLTETNGVVAEMAHAFAYGEYEQCIAEAKAKLEPLKLFDEDDYPSKAKVASAFKIRWSYFTFEVPDRIRSVSAAIYARESARLEADFADVRAQARAVLREQVQKLVDGMLSALRPDPVTGKRRTINRTFGVKLADYLAVFPFRNIDSDDALAQQVDRMNELLRGADAEAMMMDQPLRDVVTQGFEEVAGVLAALVEEAPLRRFNLRSAEDEEAEEVEA